MCRIASKPTVEFVQSALDSATASVDVMEHVCHPGDLSRDRKKGTPKKILRLLMQKQGGAMTKEIGDFFGRDGYTPTTSAVYKQRVKIKASYFKAVFENFTTSLFGLCCDRTFHGYHLLAVDGTDISYPANPEEPEYYVEKKDGQKAFNVLHLDALIDVMTGVFLDASTDGTRKKDEQEQGIRLLKKLKGLKAILLADRGYESFNMMANCIEEGLMFLIRVKDVDSNGIASALDLPQEGEFDVKISIDLTNKQTNALVAYAKEHPNELRIIEGKNFDFLPDTTSRNEPAVMYHLEFRAVRIEVEPGKFVLLFTNLPADEFPPSVLKEMYHARWGIESNFRVLKYVLETLCLTSKWSQLVKQEIYSKLLMHNFVHLVVLLVEFLEQKRKHTHRINITAAAGAVRNYLNGIISAEAMVAYIARHTVPVRDGRKYERKMGKKSPRHAFHRGG